MTIDIIVTEHARDQARDRFPGFKAARIIDEVRDAFATGRYGAQPPRNINVSRVELDRTLFVWNSLGDRCYALRPTEAFFLVTTTLRCQTGDEGIRSVAQPKGGK